MQHVYSRKSRKGENILPLGSGPKKSLCYLVFLTPKRYIRGLNFGHN